MNNLEVKAAMTANMLRPDDQDLACVRCGEPIALTKGTRTQILDVYSGYCLCPSHYHQDREMDYKVHGSHDRLSWPCVCLFHEETGL